MKLLRGILYLICAALIILAVLLLISDMSGPVPDVVYAEGALLGKNFFRLFRF